MRPRASAGVLAAALLAAGCAGAGASGGRLVLPDWGDDPVHAARIADAAATADVVYLGEQHDNPAHHARQRLILDAVTARGPRTALGFEMLAASRQPAVDEALAGPPPPTRAEVERRLGWRESGWPDFAMYWPLFELAVRRGLPVLALDIDPALARRIAREGLAAAPDGDALRSALPPDPAREAALARAIADAHCDLLPADRIPRMVDAWHARNVAMARRIAGAIDGGQRVVVVVGRGHQAPGGLPAQLAALRPGTRQFVVELAEAGPGAAGAAAAARSGADAVWLTPRVERPDPCAPLRRPAGAALAARVSRPGVLTSGLVHGDGR